VAALRSLELRYTARAQRQLQAIQEYIHERNAHAALNVGRRIRKATEMLCHFPLAGREGRLSGTREWVVTGLPYILVYEVSDENDLIILGVFHGAQDERNVR
jgi:addiction module RelE/StbE family toxin